jgi:hypothetical protein
MKHKRMSKKLTFKKETISNLELDRVLGGVDNIAVADKLTDYYSDCGTGPATIHPCMCPPTYFYSDCGTGPATIVPCMCIKLES